MGKTFAKLIIPFTFSDEDVYKVSLSGRLTRISIKHIRNNDGIEKIKGTKIHGNPKLVPDDPDGIMNISSIEVELPYTPKEINCLGGLEVEFVRYHVMKYLNRLTQTIRFTTRRYWLRLISEKDIDIYSIEFDENSGEKYTIPIIFSAQSGYDFPLKVLHENNVKNFIHQILIEEIKLPLAENYTLKD